MNPVTIASLMDIRFVSHPVISPDGRYTGFVVEKQNAEENRYEGYIHVLENAAGTTRQLTFSGRESGFIWEDGHTLLFQSERGEADRPKKHRQRSAFYRLDVDGGEARRAFALDMKVTGVKPLGAGRFVVCGEADLNAPPEDASDAALDDLADYHVIEEVPLWANGRGYVSRVRSALFLYDEGDGALRKLTPDHFDVAAWDARGDRLVYAGCEFRDRRGACDEVRCCDLRTYKTRTLVGPDGYSVGEVLLTDAGVVAAMTDMRPWGLGQLKDWYRIDPATGELRLAARMHRCIGGAAVLDCAHGGGRRAAAVGECVVFIAQREYRAEVCRLNADDTVQTLAPFEGAALWLDANADRVVFAGMEPDGLTELYAVRAGGAARLTGVNDAYLSAHDVAKVEYIPFTDADGLRVDGWVLRPADFDPEKRYPGVLEIHGGPRGAYGTPFFHEMQALCGAGYVVFFCNPPGSEGYGEAFADLRGKYGDIDYRDLMAFTDHVPRTVPQLDPYRLAACGGSYGGFMCNWIEGHTDRFAAIASQRSISNWVADFGTSEIGFTFDINEFCGDPWTAHDRMWAQSPLKYAANAKTPILFIHSLCDYNCTVDQGVQMFSAMKYFGVPARMCLFEGENHSLSRSGKPRHRLRRLEEIVGWFDRYAGNKTQQKAR